jgi:tetratricopeptide (TPR) repeat protein
VRSAISIGGRYLVLASTSWGASAFHEPARVDRWSDPWLLAALLFGAVLGGRLLYTLALRRAEAVWWLWAAAAFAPVSQIFEFLYPMADRYLYLVLPGLIGGVLTLWCAGGRLERGPWRTVSMVATLVVVLGFGVHASARARIWHSNLALMRDAARHYPAGIAAHHMRARDAAVAGDVAGTVRELRGALERGWDYFPDLQTDAVYLPLRTHPDFLALEQDVVKEWLEKEVRRPRPTQASVYRRAQAYVMLGDLERAVEAYEQAIEFGGPWTASLAEEVGPLRARLRAEQRRSARE